jgi:hypothetical protein
MQYWMNFFQIWTRSTPSARGPTTHIRTDGSTPWCHGDLQSSESYRLLQLHSGYALWIWNRLVLIVGRIYNLLRAGRPYARYNEQKQSPRMKVEDFVVAMTHLLRGCNVKIGCAGAPIMVKTAFRRPSTIRVPMPQDERLDQNYGHS